MEIYISIIFNEVFCSSDYNVFIYFSLNLLILIMFSNRNLKENVKKPIFAHKGVNKRNSVLL